LGNPEEGSSIGDFESWRKGPGSGDGASLYRGSVDGASGGVPSL